MGGCLRRRERQAAAVHLGHDPALQKQKPLERFRKEDVILHPSHPLLPKLLTSLLAL